MLMHSGQFSQLTLSVIKISLRKPISKYPDLNKQTNWFAMQERKLQLMIVFHII